MGEEGEREEEEANKHIWRQKEMISLVNFVSRPPPLVALHLPQVERDGLPQ